MSPAVPLPMVSDRRSFGVIIGVDRTSGPRPPARSSPAATGCPSRWQIDATLAVYRQLARWAAQFEVRRWAVENARGLGRHLAQWLAARGQQVKYVPAVAASAPRGP
jgi:transposase